MTAAVSTSDILGCARAAFAGRHRDHALLLLGVGIGLPAIAAPGLRLVGLDELFATWLSLASFGASWRLMARPDDGLGQALTYGLKAALPLLLAGTIALLGGGLMVAGLVMLTVGLAALSSLASGNLGPLMAVGPMILMVLMLLLLLPAAIWVAARLCLTGPLMAAAGRLNPLAMLGASWRLTAAAQWRLVLVIAVATVLLVVIGGILLGLVHALAFGTGTAVIGGPASGYLTSAPLAYLAVGIPAGAYGAMIGRRPAEIFS